MNDDDDDIFISVMSLCHGCVLILWTAEQKGWNTVKSGLTGAKTNENTGNANAPSVP